MRDIDITGSKILIVDDNPQNLQVVGNLLKPQRFHLQFAMSGDKVFDAVQENRPDLILLDIHMPGMDGFEVAGKLSEDPAYRNIPVIFLTAAYKDEESIVRGFQSGGVDYVTKPFFTEELVARIKTHLQLKKYKEYLEELSYTDPLTSLLNRRSMLERIYTEQKRSQRSNTCFTVIIADIDYFKTVNDTYGHDCGDAVLVGVARTLGRRIREQDLAARWGGEEFLLLLPETESEGGSILAENLRKAVAEKHFSCGSNTVNITMTFGISCCDPGTTDINVCIKEADEALFLGKNEGRNRCVVYKKPQE